MRPRRKEAECDPNLYKGAEDRPDSEHATWDRRESQRKQKERGDSRALSKGKIEFNDTGVFRLRLLYWPVAK
jgi:hypothetical protein